MKLTSGFLGLVAAVQNVVAIPFMSFESADLVASAPVNSLVCNGDTYQRTADLTYGDGQWGAQWGAAIFHTGLFGAPDHTETIRNMAKGAVRVTHLACDGERYKCTANLDYGDGKWVAQWSVNVFHEGFIGNEVSMAPYPVTKLACDGETYKCTAELEYGDRRWVAQWGASVGHPTGGRVMNVTPSFLRQ